MQQPSFIKNKHIVITEFFWEYLDSEKEVLKFQGPNRKKGYYYNAKSRRYYFKDIRKVLIRTKKNWITVQIRGKRNNILSEFYTNNLGKATKLADAFTYMKNKSRYDI